MNSFCDLFSISRLIFFTHRLQHRKFIHSLENKHFTVDSIFKKRLYQGTVISTVTNHLFSVLRGKPVNENERLCAFAVGAATPLYDDLLDETGLTHEDIMQAVGDDNHPMRHQIRLFHYLMQQAFDHVSLSADYRRFFDLVVQSQKESLRQELPQILDKSEVARLTAEKGGYATLLFRHILENPLRHGEQEAIFALGNMLQYVNDLFGLWFDSQKKRQTLVTMSNDTAEMRKTFHQLFDKAASLSLSMDYPDKNIKRYLKIVCLIASRALVCLDHYDTFITGETPFEPNKLSRQQLVCDMEKPVNLLSNLQQSGQLYRQFTR